MKMLRLTWTHTVHVMIDNQMTDDWESINFKNDKIHS